MQFALNLGTKFFMKSAFALFTIVMLLSCNGQKDKVTPESIGNNQVALVKLANSPAFNQSFTEVMDAYFELKNNFIAEKDSGIAQSSRALMKAADSLKLNELKAYWISKPQDLLNPYLPKAATPCCEIKDTIKMGKLP